MKQARPVLSPLLVGRDDVLGRADSWIAEAGQGRGHVLLVAGEPGIGKTRLVRSIGRKAAAAGMRWTGGDIAPQDRQVPLASIMEMARSVRGHPRYGTLGADLLEIQSGEGADSLGSRRILVRAVVDRILAALDEPTLLTFEDLQWADELSLEVIGDLARFAADRPLLLVAIYRLDEMRAAPLHREWRSRLLAQRLAEEARLAALTYDETALVTTLILGTGLPAPRDVVQAVWERTDGIPLHIEELLAALDDDARADGRRIREVHVPDTIEDAVLARMSHLSPDARALARAGAVIGRCFVPDVVSGMLDRPLGELDEPIQELVEASILYPFSYLDRGYYDFRHQLLRDAVYGTVGQAELRRLHARAGEFGSLLDGQAVAHASLHFERAGLRAQAYRAALAGAQAAAAVSSRQESFDLYARAVANAPDDLPPLALAELYTAYSDAAAAVDDVAVAEQAGRLARRYNLAAGRPVEAVLDLVMLAGMARRDVRSVDERRALIVRAREEAEGLPDSPERSMALSDVRVMEAILELDGGRHDAARTLFDAARQARRASNDPDTADIDFMAGELDVMGGEQGGEGLRAILRIARDARGARAESTGVTAFRWASALAIRVLDYPTAHTAVDEGLRYADEIEQSYCRHVLAATSAHLAWAEGRWDDAVATAEIELVQRGSRRGTIGSRDVLALVALGRGDTERARTLLDGTLEIVRPSGELPLLLPTLWALAETELLDGDPAAALRWCDEAVGLATPTDERAMLVPFVVTGTRAAIAARRPDDAARWLTEIAGLLSAKQAVAGPALDHATGLLRTAEGHTVAARTALEAAVAGWARIGRTWERLWAQLDLATCLLRANREGEALVVLGDVRGAALGLGSTPLVARADELAGIARSRGAEAEPWRPLTAREFEVARLVADGMTNGEIATSLGLSPRTVGAHVEHILAKLGFTRRAEIAAWVAGMGVTAAAGG